ncbi:MAG: amidase, partial [Calditrichaeota bacterium]|nr:amidase [Calditrichota bacterium]
DGLRIRQILADESGKPLPSNFFFLNKSPANPEKFYIFGAGAGHGSGMCQWGAIGMSMKGYKYNNILGLYYPQLATQKM